MRIAIGGLRPAQFSELDEVNLEPLVEEAFDELEAAGLLLGLVSGLVSGVEHLAAERAYARSVPVHVILTCSTQAEPWPITVQVRFLKLLQQAASLKFVTEGKFYSTIARDQTNLVLTHADMVLTFFDRRETVSGGILGRAVCQGLDILNCNPFTQQWESYREGQGWCDGELHELVRELC